MTNARSALLLGREDTFRVRHYVQPGVVKVTPSGAFGVALNARLNQPLVGCEFGLRDGLLIDRTLATKAAPMGVAVGGARRGG